MGPLELPQRLLSDSPCFPVWLDRVAELGQGGLRSENQMGPVTAGLPGQEFRNWIGRWRRALGGLYRPRWRKSRRTTGLAARCFPG